MLAQLPPALQNLKIPLRLKLWDGHELDLGPTPSVTIVVKDPKIVSEFMHPSLDLLGSAFVEGRLELAEGSISEVVRVCDELSQALLDEDDDSTPARNYHDKATDAASISYHYDLSNAFYQLWLDREMVYSCGYFETGKRAWMKLSKPSFATCAENFGSSQVSTCWMSAVAGAGWHVLQHANSGSRCLVSP